jgi:uncharacterized protein YndB with AHSA1/START domain
VTANSLADPASSGAVDTASIHVAAPPEVVWDLVSDLDNIRSWSPECYRVRWTGKPTGPVVGAKFLGFNRQGWRRWFTRNIVEESDPGKSFAWLTRDNKTRWAFHLEPDGDGTVLTQTRTLPPRRPFAPKMAIVLFLGGLQTHNTHMRQNMQQSLTAIKTTAEAP